MSAPIDQRAVDALAARQGWVRSPNSSTIRVATLPSWTVFVDGGRATARGTGKKTAGMSSTGTPGSRDPSRRLSWSVRVPQSVDSAAAFALRLLGELAIEMSKPGTPASRTDQKPDQPPTILAPSGQNPEASCDSDYYRPGSTRSVQVGPELLAALPKVADIGEWTLSANSALAVLRGVKPWNTGVTRVGVWTDSRHYGERLQWDGPVHPAVRASAVEVVQVVRQRAQPTG